jgi:hypothetical protein
MMTPLQRLVYAIFYAITMAIEDAREDRNKSPEELVDPSDGTLVFRFRRVVRASKGDTVK